MTMRRTAGLACFGLLASLILAAAGLDGGRPSLLERIDDTAYWRLVTDFSEPGGYFRSDNLVSNERTFPGVLSEVARRSSSRSAYVGVGPEQNFSYINALRPRVAFIVDIRRQNAVLHLLYKALFELSPNRTEFLSRLFSRPRPKELGTHPSVHDLFQAFAAAPAPPEVFASNLEGVRRQLIQRHHFALSDGDLTALREVYRAFFEGGPDLRYSSRSIRRGRPFPTIAELMTAVDDQGVPRSFLANEESYLAVREMQRRNLVVPVVGDFAGGKALKAVAAYLAARGLTVTAFYTSNVEFYLFRTDDWRSFYGNVAALPVDRRSVLVRSVFRGLGGFGLGYPGTGLEGRLALDPIEDLVAAFRRGQIAGYGDIVARSK
jgi:hypothetical protein